MRSFRLPVTTLPQPDETTCGPTCLHAVYDYFGDRADLKIVPSGQCGRYREAEPLLQSLHARFPDDKDVLFNYGMVLSDQGNLQAACSLLGRFVELLGGDVDTEIDDLIIVRPDGVPTYNFAVVVDDWDMDISHVFRGDEHINNTPWQINIFRALGAPLPQFGHCPIILGDDGLKLSKRRGAVSVMAYEEMGYLPEAILNYLARLGWSHGDEELFTREQVVQWFDGSHLAKSPAQWDPAKLAWVNAHYVKVADDARLAKLVAAVANAAVPKFTVVIGNSFGAIVGQADDALRTGVKHKCRVAGVADPLQFAT